jgi:hypothetical protein
MFSDHFYPKNKESISESRDFAEQTLTKNGVDAILPDPETICDLREFAKDTLLKNGTCDNFTPDTLSDSIFFNVFGPENTAVFMDNSSETGNFRKNNHNGETDHAIFFAKKLPNFYRAFFFVGPKKFQNFKFTKSKFYKKFKNESPNFSIRFGPVWSWTAHFRVHTNLGGRGHRFGIDLVRTHLFPKLNTVRLI